MDLSEEFKGTSKTLRRQRAKEEWEKRQVSSDFMQISRISIFSPHSATYN